VKKSNNLNLVTSYGVVVIGRNEGERLEICLNSILKYTDKLVYVDSGSTDGSVDMAKSMRANVIDLNQNFPFTAARARNAGFQKLNKLFPDVTYVQFVDGDCEICEGWFEVAVDFLEKNKNVAIASGRLHERFPDKSIYNMLCDIEWDTPIGESTSCGGIVMMRGSAFKQIGGFKQDLIAGEEPELCVRLRGREWKVWRIDTNMALHDAAMLRFSQWWVRSMRSGYAFAEGTCLHGASPARHWVRQTISSLVWGLGLPLIVVVLILLSKYWGLLILALYPIQIFRIYKKGTRSSRVNWIHAIFLVFSKFPEMIGIMRFVRHKLLGGRKELIEHK